MGRFKITQGIIEDGIKEKMENLKNLRSWSKKFVSGQPKIINFEDFKGKAESITSKTLYGANTSPCLAEREQDE
jgi:hypothetical protein